MVVLLPPLVVFLAGGYAWSDMDWDRSGMTSLCEVMDSINVGTRPSLRSPGCMEFFWLKDGQPIYERCPTN